MASVVLKDMDSDKRIYHDVLTAWMAITRGAFNPELADYDALAQLKEKYGVKPIELTVTRYILTKQ